MASANVKQQVHELVDQLPDDVTWDDVVYRIAVRRSIEIGLRESEFGKGVDTDTLRRELGLSG